MFQSFARNTLICSHIRHFKNLQHSYQTDIDEAQELPEAELEKMLKHFRTIQTKAWNLNLVSQLN